MPNDDRCLTFLLIDFFIFLILERNLLCADAPASNLDMTVLMSVVKCA